MKCSFGVVEGKFLGYIVTLKGIRVNPKKTKAIADMESLKTLKEMQSLSGKLAALNRFLSRFVKRSLPFFETLKNITKENKDEYKWTEKAKLAFQELKRLILELPMLATLERANKTPIGTVAVALHEVITDQPIKQILNKPEVLGKLAKYAIKLGAYSITYIPRTTVKGQVLADFINEVPVGTRQLEYTYAIRLTFPSINNKAEYEALLAGLRIARKMKVHVLNVKVDLKLVACEMNGEFVASNEGMEKYLAKAKEQNAWRERIWPNNWKTGASRSGMKIKPICDGKTELLVQEVIPLSDVKWAKIVRQGYYWPSMHGDTKEVIDKCDSCQIHAPVPKLPKTRLTSIMSPWPFYQWGLDILGPLPEGPEKLKFIIVAIDYFTKWIEVKPLAKTTGREVKNFVWQNIICRFGLPRVIVTDIGTQLVNDPIKSWCEKWKIKQMNTVVAHPQANGLVEKANKSLMHGLKARLGRERVGWVDELPNILWAHRTMLKTSNGETPFSLTYGSEAVIPIEIGMPTYRIIHFNEAQNEEEMRLNLDLSQERREAAAICEARYKKKVEQYYNKRVRPMSFKVGAFVYRKNATSRVENQGKLGPNWEGLYRVTEAYSNGSYKLATMDNREVPRTWHAINLRNCFMGELGLELLGIINFVLSIVPAVRHVWFLLASIVPAGRVTL
ncbi:reverse transcriptase domain-containing protein [Tanacetum coccineum]